MKLDKIHLKKKIKNHFFSASAFSVILFCIDYQVRCQEENGEHRGLRGGTKNQLTLQICIMVATVCAIH